MWTQRGKACLLLISNTNTNCETWPIDPLGLNNAQLEVSDKLPQGYRACDNQAFVATLRVDPSLSALPIIETQKSQSVGLLIRH